MPIVYGSIYPETRSAGLLRRKLRVLLDLNGDKRLILPHVLQFCTLRRYLSDLDSGSVSIELITATKKLDSEYRRFQLDEISQDDTTWTLDDYRLAAKSDDFDLVLSDRFSHPASLESAITDDVLVSNFEGGILVMETFVRGHDIPWSFRLPTWYLPWEVFYQAGDKTGTEAVHLLGLFNRHALDGTLMEWVRSLLTNRMSHICYAKDKLSFYNLQRRYAKRKGWERQSFRFESGFYFTNYCSSLWGGLDQLALILDKMLKINTEKITDVTIAKAEFVSKVSQRNQEIGAHLQNKDLQGWIAVLKELRDHCAHRGTIELSTIVQALEKEPTDEELDSEIRASQEYQEIKEWITVELLEDYYRIMKHKLRLSKYPVITDGATILNRLRSKGRFVIYPMQRIDFDFDNYCLAVLKTLALLERSLH